MRHQSVQNLAPAAPTCPVLFGVPEGYDALWLSDQARTRDAPLLHIATDDIRLSRMAGLIRFFAPEIEIIVFPAWDCLPYDRISPTGEVTGERANALSRLLTPSAGRPRIVLTTMAAALQRVPPRSVFQNASFTAKPGQRLDMKRLESFLITNGYVRSDMTREPGEYAIRGSLIDIFPAGDKAPCRLDLFGDEIEHIREFDPLSQRTTAPLAALELYPASEIFLTPENIARFRSSYRALFGAVHENDPLYEAISAGQRHAGQEHWLALFYERLETIFDYAPDCAVFLDHQSETARGAYLEQVRDLYQARLSMQHIDGGGAIYHPAPVDRLYLGDEEWLQLQTRHDSREFSPFGGAEGQNNAGCSKGRDFGDARAQGGLDIYRLLGEHIQTLRQQKKRVIVAAYSEGARDRLAKLLREHGIPDVQPANSFADANALKQGAVAIAILDLEHGFTTQSLAVITEQDILGDRLTRPTARERRKSETFLREISSLSEGDYVVHQDHGIGRFEKLETVIVDDVAHDCLKIIYADNDRLYIPAENIDVLARYGSAESAAHLDKLGGTGWQARRARVKKDLLAIAHELLQTAAERALHATDPVDLPDGPYEKFCARFPYPETQDQLRSINETLSDLKKTQAMDRLICGDVGFGKTEVALRAAFVAAMSGQQVAVITPTTLLCRQHYHGFMKRFAGFPVKIAQISRLVPHAERVRTYEGLADGNIHLVIGTHALLSERTKFAHLGLLIVDEEQRFGVKQKERLKKLRENVHVLTLTATPIPRTLQLALSGVKELSIMATPPIDRLAVKTFILPYDPLALREALMREHYRGGQSFYVCPRIADIAELEPRLRSLVPELKIIVAHGQMAPEEIESRMTAFYDGAYDILLSTNIVESGLDIPNANTMIIHRAELFGLAQLYQLRGRVGRSKARAYAYLTHDPAKKLTKQAQQRLQALEQLDQLGAGFQLASHDLDIRGAGNLLGEEQSGHVREVGIELYQQMLEEAIVAARLGHTTAYPESDRWSPHINIGISALIPEGYVPDLHVRLTLYRRLSELENDGDLNSFGAELIDRFGPLPAEIENLLEIVGIKQLCRTAHIEKIDAGPKGAVVSFRKNSVPYVAKLVSYISNQAGTVRLRPEDQKLVYIRGWNDTATRLKGLRKIASELAALAA